MNGGRIASAMSSRDDLGGGSVLKRSSPDVGNVSGEMFAYLGLSQLVILLESLQI